MKNSEELTRDLQRTAIFYAAACVQVQAQAATEAGDAMIAADQMWVVGVGYTLAEVQRLYDQPSVVAEIARNAGLTIEDFRRAKVDPYDLKSLRKCLPPKPRRKRGGK